MRPLRKLENSDFAYKNIMSKLIHKDLEVFSFESKADFYNWLGENYAREAGFWLRYFKVNSGKKSIIYNDSVDVALCWGWIDGLKNKYDDESYIVRYTPRRAKSIWSKVNVAKVEKLIAEKLMQPSGLKHIEAAKADGRWDAAYGGQSSTEVPSEFIKLIETDKTAKDFYDSLDKANKYAIAFRIATAVGDAKKGKIMQKMFEMLKNGKAFHPQKQVLSR